MAEQNWIYVDADYLKELEEKAKKIDYIEGVLDGFKMAVNSMRNPTEEEMESVNKYIESISKPTGVNIFDLMDEPQTEREGE